MHQERVTESRKRTAVNQPVHLTVHNTRPRLYCVDAFAGRDPGTRLKVRVICANKTDVIFLTCNAFGVLPLVAR